MNAPLRVLIVDDEAPARRVLQRMLQELPDLNIAGVAANGLQALDVLAHIPIDLLLLDIEMPVLAGMELAARLQPTVTPAVIFVTAYPQYAARAFALQAADYLLKPVEPQRLASAVERARAQLKTHEHEQQIAWLEATLRTLRTRSHAEVVTDVWVELGNGRLRLALKQIEWFAADGDYVRANTAERGYLVRDSLGRLASTLAHAHFLRVHRSILVNLDAVIAVTGAANGQLLLTMRSGAELQVGRRSRHAVRHALGWADGQDLEGESSS